MTPDEYCESKAAASGSSFYYAFRFLPPERRRAITALYAFCREVDDVVDEVTELDIARKKLLFWRSELHETSKGRPSHPVMRALAPAIARYGIPFNDLSTVIDGMQMDLETTRYTTWDELAEYCHRVAGVVGTMSARIFGFQNSQTLEYAHALGIAFQLTNIIRDVGEDARRGRIYLPLADLALFRVAQSELLKGHAGEGFMPLMRMQTQRARDLYATAFASLPAQDRAAQRPGLIMAAIYQKVLDRVEKEHYPVLTRRVSLSPLTKLFIALRTWRKP